MNRLAACWVPLVLVLAACAPLPPSTSLPVVVRPSPSFDARRPNFVVLHYTTDDTAEDSLRTLTTRASGVSAHYLVARDGTIFQLVDERMRAWHAGESFWGGNRDLNSSSVGIELDNNGREPYGEALIASLLTLLADLQTRYAIPQSNFLGHSDIAPKRKIDPGRLFPWQRLAAHGFGHWCEPPLPPATLQADGPSMLAMMGYDVSDLPSAINAFKSRYAPLADATQLTETDRSLMQCLLDQAARDRARD